MQNAKLRPKVCLPSRGKISLAFVVPWIQRQAGILSRSARLWYQPAAIATTLVALAGGARMQKKLRRRLRYGRDGGTKRKGKPRGFRLQPFEAALFVQLVAASRAWTSRYSEGVSVACGFAETLYSVWSKTRSCIKAAWLASSSALKARRVGP